MVGATGSACPVELQHSSADVHTIGLDLVSHAGATRQLQHSRKAVGWRLRPALIGLRRMVTEATDIHD